MVRLVRFFDVKLIFGRCNVDKNMICIMSVQVIEMQKYYVIINVHKNI